MPENAREEIPNVNVQNLSIAGLGIYIAGTRFYKWYKTLPKYSQSELSQYEHLVTIYRQTLEIDGQPPQWLLENNERPVYVYDFKRAEADILKKIKMLPIQNAAICFGARAILNSISQLLGSLGKRWINKVPGQSVEIYFFTELARLISDEVPTLSFDRQESLIRLNQILSFCTEADGEIILSEPVSLLTSERVTPGYTLQVIIKNLTGIIQSVEAMHQSTTFIDQNKALDSSISFMIMHAFNIMNLMISGDHDHQPDIPVAELLEEDLSHRPHLQQFKKQRLAMWEEKTLQALGIVDNRFQNTKTPTLRDADNHLAGECPSDLDCKLPRQLHDPSHADWGHWPLFLTNKQNEKLSNTQIEARLKNSREVFRDMIKLYRQRRFLADARKIAPSFGETWLYSDKIGLAIVNSLQLIIEESISKLNESLAKVMSEYTALFNAKKDGLNPTEHGYIAFQHAKGEYNGVSSKSILGFKPRCKEAKEKIAAIKKQSENHHETLPQIEAVKNQLISQIIDELNYFKKTDSQEYRTLCSEQERFIARSMASDLPAIQAHKTVFSLAEETTQQVKTMADTAEIRIIDATQLFKAAKKQTNDAEKELNEAKAYLSSIEADISAVAIAEVAKTMAKDAVKKAKTPVEKEMAKIGLATAKLDLNNKNEAAESAIKSKSHVEAKVTLLETRVAAARAEMDRLKVPVNLAVKDAADQMDLIQRVTNIAVAARNAEAAALASVAEKRLHLTELPFFQVAKVLLNLKPLSLLDQSVQLKLEMNDTFPVPVPTFYTTLHKNIYDNFLKKNRGLISSKDSLVFFRGFSSSSMPKLRELYTRVNALLKYLYSSAPIPKESELDIDRQLVEQELESAMNYYYTEIYKEPCFSYCEKAKSSVVLKHNEDNTLSIKLANHLRPYAATPLSEAYDKLHEDHVVILDEKGKLKAELEDKDRVIERQTEVIARQTEEARRQTEVIARLKEDAARQPEVVARLKEDAARQGAMIARQNEMLVEFQALMKKHPGDQLQNQNAFFSPTTSSR